MSKNTDTSIEYLFIYFSHSKTYGNVKIWVETWMRILFQSNVNANFNKREWTYRSSTHSVIIPYKKNKIISNLQMQGIYCDSQIQTSAKPSSRPGREWWMETFVLGVVACSIYVKYRIDRGWWIGPCSPLVGLQHRRKDPRKPRRSCRSCSRQQRTYEQKMEHTCTRPSDPLGYPERSKWMYTCMAGNSNKFEMLKMRYEYIYRFWFPFRGLNVFQFLTITFVPN